MKNKIFLVALIILFSGCYAHLLPKGGPDVKISSSGLIAEQESQGIKVTVDGEMSKFTKFDKYTPVFLIIKNKTDRIISLEYENFTLKDEANNIFKPFSIKEVYGKAEDNQFIEKTFFSYPYIENSRPFVPAKADKKFTGNNKEKTAKNSKRVFLVKGGAGRAGKKDRNVFIYIYPYYDPYYGYYYYPYNRFYPYYGNRFYPYDYYYGYYNPYMLYNSPYYKNAYYNPLPMDILPYREVSGYLYFPQVLKTAKDEIRLSVDIKEAEKVMEFPLKINR